MENPGQGQPPEQPQNMRFAELINRLKSGKGIPSSGFHMISIDSTPALGGELSLDPDGNPVHSFGHKFDEDFEGWKPGERVRSRFLVRKRPVKEDSPDQIRSDTVELLVSDSVVGDIRHADTFILEGLPPDDLRTLETMGIAEIDANVEVVSQIKGEVQVSNMQNYKAKLDRINGIQATYDGDPTKLERGPILVEGKVEGYAVNREYPYEGAKVTVRLENGKTADIDLQQGYLDFEGGDLEILNPSYPLPGDAIQVQSTYGRRRGDHDGFSAAFCRSTYLLRPSQERAEADGTQRRAVSQAIDELSQQDEPQAVRNGLSAIIQGNLYKKGSFDRVALTAGEKQRLRGIIDAKFPDQNERPLDMLGDTDISEGQEIQKVYGVDIYAMSYRQFFDFCIQVAKGEVKPVADGSVDYPYRVMMDRLPQEQQEEVLQTAVKTLYPKVVGKNVISRKEVLVDPQDLPDLQTGKYGHRRGDKVVLQGDFDPAELADPDNITWDDRYLFEQSLAYLSYVPTVSAADTYIDLAKSMLEQGRFMRDEHDRRHAYFEHKIFNFMRHHLINSVKMNWEDMRVEEVVNEDIARKYISQVPMLEDLSLRLEAEGWTNDGRRDPREGVNEVIDLVQLVDNRMKRK